LLASNSSPKHVQEGGVAIFGGIVRLQNENNRVSNPGGKNSMIWGQNYFELEKYRAVITCRANPISSLVGFIFLPAKNVAVPMFFTVPPNKNHGHAHLLKVIHDCYSFLA
jgi:hypothetical protein